MDEEPDTPRRWHWLAAPSLAAIPGALLSIGLGRTAYWYAYSPEAAGARADHPYVQGYTDATLVAIGFTVASFLIALVVQEMVRCLFSKS